MFSLHIYTRYYLKVLLNAATSIKCDEKNKINNNNNNNLTLFPSSYYTEYECLPGPSKTFLPVPFESSPVFLLMKMVLRNIINFLGQPVCSTFFYFEQFFEDGAWF
jgi:hypothetical protein